jgi:hypothetical protein
MQKTAAAIALCLSLAPAARAQIPGAPPRGPTTNPPPPMVSGTGAGASGGSRSEAASKAPLPRGAVLEEVSGLVSELDRKAYKLTIESVSGPVTLALDRNTMVYTANGLGTVLDLAPGQQIRAGRNADFLAYWVQLRVARPEPSPTPAQGTGPAGSGAAPATESTGKGAGPPPAPPTPTPGGVPPGAGPVGGGTNPGQ